MYKKFWRYDESELENIKDAIKSGLHGKWNKILEEKFADKFGVKYTIGINSGTSALHTALYAVGVREGDEVIVPPLTFGAPAFATLLLGAVPIFADVDINTFNIDPKEIERKITKRTKAIVPVSLYGLPADIDPIMKLAKENNIKVVEDDAECFLGEYNGGRIAGTVADISIFSFQRSKHMTSETGGMIVTNDEELAEKARKFSILGYKTLRAKAGEKVVTMDQVQRPDFERHELVAPNYRLPELCAAVLVAQLEKLDGFVKKRREISNIYFDAINDCEWLIPQETPKGFKNSYWTAVMRLDTDKIDFSWIDFRNKYLENGGEPYYAAWVLTYLEPALIGKEYTDNNVIYQKGLCPIAERIQPQLIQMKTNFYNLAEAEKQAKILNMTIKNFS